MPISSASTGGLRRAALAVSLILALASESARAAPLPAAPRAWVTDGAGLLSTSTRHQLDARLAEFQRRTGHQVVVWIADSIGDESLEDWAARTFAAWALGQKGKDNGVALFVLTRDRKARIEVGYGLEGTLPDLRASRILREILIPGMRSGQAERSVPASADAIMRVLAPGQVPAGETRVQPTSDDRQRRSLSPMKLILLGLGALLFLVVLVTNPSLALLILYSIFSGGRGGGGGGWGGGFSGGGGRSGGGGASGSW